MIAISAFCSPASFSMSIAHFSWTTVYRSSAWDNDEQLVEEGWSHSFTEGWGGPFHMPPLGDGESWSGD